MLFVKSCSENTGVTELPPAELWQSLLASSMKWKKLGNIYFWVLWWKAYVPRLSASPSSLSSTYLIHIQNLLKMTLSATEWCTLWSLFPSLKHLRSFRSTKVYYLSFSSLFTPEISTGERSSHVIGGEICHVALRWISFKKLRTTTNFLTNYFHITSVVQHEDTSKNAFQYHFVANYIHQFPQWSF